MASGNLSSIFGSAGFNAAAFAPLPVDPPEVQFREALASIGIEPHEIIGDGQIHRVNGRDDLKKSAWYILYLNGDLAAGCFGDWRTCEKQNWRAISGRTLSCQEQQAIQLKVAAAKQKRDDELSKSRDEAAEKAEADLDSAIPATSAHPYLLKKNVGSYGLWQLAEKLIVPMVNGDGRTLRSYQSIDAQGNKMFLKGSQAKGCYHLIPGDTTTIYIGEGYATCATVFEAAGSAVYAALSASNLVEVAVTVRKMNPAAKIIILGDNGPAGIEWSTKAAEAAGGEAVMASGFKPDGKGNDFNDMGIEATRLALGIVTKKAKAEPTGAAEQSIEDEFSPIPDHLINLSGVGGILARIQKYTLDTAPIPNPAAAAVGALALVGTIMANKVQTNTGLRSNNQLILVAGTGTGKEHPRKINKAILMAAGLKDYIGGEEIASGQGVMASASINPTSIFQLDEFGMMLQAVVSDKAGSWQKAIMSSFMKLHSGAGSIVAGQERADQDKHPRVDVHFPCISLFATTTANQLVPALRSAQVASGFANRMIFLLTKSKRQKRNMQALLTAPPSDIIAWVKAARAYHHNMAGMTPENPVTVGMNDAAASLFEAWEDEILSLQDKGPTYESMYVRAWEHASKLAMIVAMSRMTVQALAEFQGCEITGIDAKWAIEFIRFSFAEMVRLIEARVSDTEFEGHCKEVLRLIHRAGEQGMTERELGIASRSFRGLDGLARDKIFAVLQRTEQIARVPFEPVSGRGRRRIAWVACD